MKIVKRLSRNGSVVVFHDSIKAQKNMFAVLPQAIEFWQQEGYQFKVL
jgi:peptidoglycan-N-acetylglucosamine deacetylase